MFLIPARELQPTTAMAQALHICLHNDAWKDRSIADFDKWIATPVLLGQAFFGTTKEGPMAMCTWARVPEYFENAVFRDSWTVEDWDNGSVLWAMDMIANEGSGKEFTKLLWGALDNFGTPAFWWRSKQQRVGHYIPGGSHGRKQQRRLR